jgi:hypothetical protein
VFRAARRNDAELKGNKAVNEPGFVIFVVWNDKVIKRLVSLMCPTM